VVIHAFSETADEEHEKHSSEYGGDVGLVVTDTILDFLLELSQKCRTLGSK
jgi:hypothetical protein